MNQEKNEENILSDDMCLNEKKISVEIEKIFKNIENISMLVDIYKEKINEMNEKQNEINKIKKTIDSKILLKRSLEQTNDVVCKLIDYFENHKKKIIERSMRINLITDEENLNINTSNLGEIAKKKTEMVGEISKIKSLISINFIDIYKINRGYQDLSIINGKNQKISFPNDKTLSIKIEKISKNIDNLIELINNYGEKINEMNVKQNEINKKKRLIDSKILFREYLRQIYDIVINLINYFGNYSKKIVERTMKIDIISEEEKLKLQLSNLAEIVIKNTELTNNMSKLIDSISLNFVYIDEINQKHKEYQN